MSWPKLNDQWKIIFILMQMSRSSRRWQEHQKKKKQIEGENLDSKTFPISRDFGPYSMVKDVGSQKVDITIGQLLAMVLLARRKLRKGLSISKIPKVPTPLNATTIEHECDPIINVQGNGLMLRGMLMNGRVRINVMTIPTMRYSGLKIDRLTLVTQMVNKRIVKLEKVIINVAITKLKVSTIVDFHVVLKENEAYPMIYGRPWLIKSHAKNY
jgi:hypothetical protein